MAIKPIITYNPEKPDKEAYKTLTTKSEPIDIGGEDYTELFEDMLDTALHHLPRCVGLAAVQIGVHKRAILVRWGSTFVPMVNPEVVAVSEKMCPMKEGCLSLPHSKPTETSRHKSLKLKYFDPLFGVWRTQKFKGRDAVIIQHELNHLDGVLI